MTNSDTDGWTVNEAESEADWLARQDPKSGRHNLELLHVITADSGEILEILDCLDRVCPAHPDHGREAETQDLSDVLRERLTGPAVDWPVRDEVEAKIEGNDARLRTLAFSGVQLDQAGLVATRMAMLTEQLLGNMDSPARLAFESRLADVYAEQVGAVEAQVRQAQLMNGVGPIMPNPPGQSGKLIIP